jgi:hypothetical protein
VGDERLKAGVYVGGVSWENAILVKCVFDMRVELMMCVRRKENDARAKGLFFVGGEGMYVWSESGVVNCRVDWRKDLRLKRLTNWSWT